MTESDQVDISLDRLLPYLKAEGVIHKTDPVSIQKFPHGQSNPTYLLDVDGYRIVIRRKPFGKLLPSAHAIEREYAVMKVLKMYSDVPVPTMIHLCTDGSVIGAPFFVMEYVAGRIFQDPSLPGLKADSRFAIYADAVRVLAAIHSFDHKSHLNRFGSKPQQYARRQLQTWTRQYEASKTSDIAAMDQLQKFLDQSLPEEIPDSQCSLVHGDFRIDNCIVHPTEDRIVAVLDWELSTLGDPLCDLAYFSLMYHLLDVPGIPSLKGKLLPGIPEEADLHSAYSKIAGRSVNPQHIQPLMGLACFRIAGICQGVLKRSLLGNASSKKAREIGQLCPILAKIGLELGYRKRISLDEKKLPLQLEPFRMHFSTRFFDIRSRLLDFMEAVIYPAERTYFQQQNTNKNRWEVPPIMESLRSAAKQRGLFNLFLSCPVELDGFHHKPLTNLEYAPLCEIMGTSIFLAPEACNCNAPDTGNMELLALYGTKEQKSQWLRPLLDGSIRSCFAMTERFVASSDATQIQCSIRQDGKFWVINGRKWWTSGAMHPNCKLMIVMGKTDPELSSTSKQHSFILVPMDTPGIIVQRHLTVFGYDDAPEGHGEVRLINVRVPLSNILGQRGEGFAMAQARLGPGRIHHCMRALGVGEVALQLMCKRAKCRSTFHQKFSNNDSVLDDIAESRTELDQCRALVMNTAALVDLQGNRRARHALSIVKIGVPRAVLAVVDRAIQLYGAEGVGPDSPLPKLWAGIRSLRIADGPDAVHKFSVSKHELRLCKL